MAGVPLRTDATVVAKSPASSVLPTRFAGDPPCRSDGLCLLEACGKPRSRVAVRHEDPFCCTECCRIWWDAVDARPEPEHGRGASRL
jgi:hypothetical protein